MNPVEQFRDAIRGAGLSPPELIESDGRLHRFPSNGKRSDDAGWYVLHDDGIPAGHFGDWRTGVSQPWRADIGRTLTSAEEAAYRARVEAIRQQREAEEARCRVEAASRAAAILQAAQPATDDHPYLIKKRVKAHGARLHNGALVIPVRDGGELHSVQFITPEGDKRFLTGGRVAGCYFSIGTARDATAVCIAEGFATGATIHEATGYPVAVAFNAGNLEPVAQALHARFPDLPLILCADDDAATEGNPGLTKATTAARAVGGRVAIPAFGTDRPDDAKDFNDLAAHRGLATVERAIAGATAPARAEHQPGRENRLAAGAEAWPEPLAEQAFHGLAGEIVRAIAPQTESDPAAVLLQVLVAFGALVGRGPHVVVEGDQHHASLFALIVGNTSKARKGTSWGRVREIFSRVADWPSVVDGLSSGEGLKWHVRDTTDADPGVADKRLLIVESEFAQVLRQSARAGNTLSSTIRSAWDSGNLRTLTKHDPITATSAHVSIIGHITRDELRSELTATDSANGFANRFVFMCARRSQSLPFGGEALPADKLKSFAQRLAEAARHARTLNSIKMDEAARQAWAAVYPALSEGFTGLLGAVTARAEAQCLRLALVYALMDNATSIGEAHMLAALAVWERSLASAQHIFGSALGEPVADEILRALKVKGSAGLTRTEINRLFKGHQNAERIGAALSLLTERGLAAAKSGPESGGRTAEVWTAL